ncbi:hypothetical protein PCANC_24715 [Puccinia coronata f. sp. avenae]|uniref:Uncharacterized protein n=1 Tax=Puccinia coronata f. sp. avenae TaxID=200324 RepID=A0A2N5TPQ2_9BASI|nr:hypothetical protein PCANC_24715 [Puccinia coronata f. sp. avenae]
MAMACLASKPWPWTASRASHGHSLLREQAMAMACFARKPWPWPAPRASHGHGLVREKAMAVAFRCKSCGYPGMYLKDPPDGRFFWRVPGYLVLFCQNSGTRTRTRHPPAGTRYHVTGTPPPTGAGYPPAVPLGDS